MMTFMPWDWYWLAEDGRLFSSKTAGLVDATAAAYVAFLAMGNYATQWPRDNSGNQTDAALSDVLKANGLPAYESTKTAKEA